MGNVELYKLRRNMGLCTLCGTPLEKEGGKYRYTCPECRAKKRAYQAQYKQGVRIREERSAEAIREVGIPKGFQVCGKAADRRRQNQRFWRGAGELAGKPSKKARDTAPRMKAPEKCQTCVWASYAGGGIWFCPLVGCAKTGRRGVKVCQS